MTITERICVNNFLFICDVSYVHLEDYKPIIARVITDRMVKAGVTGWGFIDLRVVSEEWDSFKVEVKIRLNTSDMKEITSEALSGIAIPVAYFDEKRRKDFDMVLSDFVVKDGALLEFNRAEPKPGNVVFEGKLSFVFKD